MASTCISDLRPQEKFDIVFARSDSVSSASLEVLKADVNILLIHLLDKTIKKRPGAIPDQIQAECRGLLQGSDPLPIKMQSLWAKAHVHLEPILEPSLFAFLRKWGEVPRSIDGTSEKAMTTPSSDGDSSEEFIRIDSSDDTHETSQDETATSSTSTTATPQTSSFLENLLNRLNPWGTKK